jgi:hypothetical protein
MERKQEGLPSVSGSHLVDLPSMLRDHQPIRVRILPKVRPYIHDEPITGFHMNEDVMRVWGEVSDGERVPTRKGPVDIESQRTNHLPAHFTHPNEIDVFSETCGFGHDQNSSFHGNSSPPKVDREGPCLKRAAVYPFPGE